MKMELKNITASAKGGVAIPAIMWIMGVPLTVVILAWLLFFRG